MSALKTTVASGIIAILSTIPMCSPSKPNPTMVVIDGFVSVNGFTVLKTGSHTVKITDKTDNSFSAEISTYDGVFHGILPNGHQYIAQIINLRPGCVSQSRTGTARTTALNVVLILNNSSC